MPPCETCGRGVYESADLEMLSWPSQRQEDGCSCRGLRTFSLGRPMSILWAHGSKGLRQEGR
eukprot:526835-Alexandrium_andersonii.AAC.1